MAAAKQHAAESMWNERISTPPQISQSQRSSNSNLHNQKFIRQQSNELDSVEKYENEGDYGEKCSDDSIPRPSRQLVKMESLGSSHNSSNHSNSILQNGKKRPINPFSGKKLLSLLILVNKSVAVVSLLFHLSLTTCIYYFSIHLTQIPCKYRNQEPKTAYFSPFKHFD